MNLHPAIKTLALASGHDVALCRFLSRPYQESECRLGNDAGARPVSTLAVMKRQIASPRADHVEIIVNRVKEHEGNYGYSAVTGEYRDLVQEGIRDPAKVARLALQNAASVAVLLLTTGGRGRGA